MRKILKDPISIMLLFLIALVLTVMSGVFQRSEEVNTVRNPIQPSWTNDPTMLGFVEERSIYTSNLTTGVITKVLEHSWQAYEPDWSSTGQIVFTSNDSGVFQLYVAHADGTNVHQIGVQGFQAEWSPDGSQIAYIGHDGIDYEVFVVDADGTNE